MIIKMWFKNVRWQCSTSRSTVTFTFGTQACSPFSNEKWSRATKRNIRYAEIQFFKCTTNQIRISVSLYGVRVPLARCESPWSSSCVTNVWWCWYSFKTFYNCLWRIKIHTYAHSQPPINSYKRDTFVHVHVHEYTSQTNSVVLVRLKTEVGFRHLLYMQTHRLHVLHAVKIYAGWNRYPKENQQKLKLNTANTAKMEWSLVNQINGTTALNSCRSEHDNNVR